MEISTSKLLGHPKSHTDKNYNYIHTEGGKSKYGKATTFGFYPLHRINVTTEELLKPETAYCCALFHKDSKPSKAGKAQYLRSEKNIELINGFMPFDFDDVTEEELKNITQLLTDKGYRYYAMYSQSHTPQTPKVKLLLYTGLIFTQENLNVYASAYYAVADYFNFSVVMDESSSDPARLIAPFSNPHLQDKPVVYSTNEPKEPTRTPIDLTTLTPKTKTKEEQSKALALPSYPTPLKNIREAKQDLTTSILYNIDIVKNNTRMSVPLAQAAQWKSQGVSFQLQCACGDGANHTQKDRVGYGIMVDMGDNNYSIICNGGNPDKHKGVKFSLIAKKTINPKQAIETEKYIRLSHAVVINKATGYLVNIQHPKVFNQAINDFAEGYVNWEGVASICSNLRYYTESDSFRLMASVNTEDRLLSHNVLDVASVDLSTGPLLKRKTVMKNGKPLEVYPCELKPFYSTLIEFIKSNCVRIERIENKVSNSYTNHEEVVGTTLIKYKQFNRIVVPTTKPLYADEAYSHFISKHTELPSYLHNLAVYSNLTAEERGGDRFMFLFGAGGSGKGIVANALFNCGAATPFSASALAALGGDKDVKIPEKPKDLSEHMLAFITDTKMPRTLLANAKMLTDRFMARNNYGDGELVELCALWITAADNINVYEFFNGVDAGQILRRFRIPKMERLHTSLLGETHPQHIDRDEWAEQTEALKQYVKGVEYHVALTLADKIEEGVREPVEVKELIDRQTIVKGKEFLLPRLIFNMMDDLVTRSRLRLVTNSAELQADEPYEYFSKHFGITSKGAIVLGQRGITEYGNAIDKADTNAEGAFGYRTQQTYLMDFLDKVDNKSGRTTANSAYRESTKLNYNYSMPFNGEVYCNVRAKVEGSIYDLVSKSDSAKLDEDELHQKLLEAIGNRELDSYRKGQLVGALMALYHDKVAEVEEVTTAPIKIDNSIGDLL